MRYFEMSVRIKSAATERNIPEDQNRQHWQSEYISWCTTAKRTSCAEQNGQRMSPTEQGDSSSISHETEKYRRFWEKKNDPGL